MPRFIETGPRDWRRLFLTLHSDTRTVVETFEQRFKVDFKPSFRHSTSISSLETDTRTVMMTVYGSIWRRVRVFRHGESV